MKKIILSLLSILVLSSIAFAQKGTVEFSLNSGFNHSNIKFINDPTSYLIPKISYRYGIGIKKEVFKNFHLGVELNMEEKGWLRKNVAIGETTIGFLSEGNVDFYYPMLGVPILVDYGFKYKGFSGFAEGGFMTSIKRPGGAIKTGYDNTIGVSLVQPYYAALFTFGFSYGVGLKCRVYKNWNISVMARSARDVTGIGTWGDEKKYARHKNYTGLLALSYTLKKETKK